MTTISGAARAASIAGLAGQVRGRVIGPDSQDWDEARRPWNRRVDQRPAMVVDAEGPDDIGLQAVSGARVVHEGYFGQGAHPRPASPRAARTACRAARRSGHREVAAALRGARRSGRRHIPGGARLRAAQMPVPGPREGRAAARADRDRGQPRPARRMDVRHAARADTRLPPRRLAPEDGPRHTTRASAS